MRNKKLFIFALVVMTFLVQFTFAQRPTPDGGPCLLGVGKCSSSTGGSTGSSTSSNTTTSTPPTGIKYPDVNLLQRRLHQMDANLYRLWIERERARYSYQYTGQASEAQRFQNAQRAIEQAQQQHITALRDFRTQFQEALINDFKSNPGNQTYRAQWEQAINTNKQAYAQEYQTYQKLFGLKQPRFSGLPTTIFHDPETDKGVIPVLYWLHTP